MTNFEKFKNELLQINETGDRIGVHKNTRIPIRCHSTISFMECKDCLFYKNCNSNNFLKWLYAEYKEPVPKLTKAEKGFCEIIKDGYIARDKNGDLYLYNNPPYVTEMDWRECGHCTKLCSKFFPFITWESGKAWNINELLALEVEE